MESGDMKKDVSEDTWIGFGSESLLEFSGPMGIQSIWQLRKNGGVEEIEGEEAML